MTSRAHDHTSEGLDGRLAGRLDDLLDIARAVGSTLDLDTLLQAVMDRVTRLVGADRSTLYVVDRPAGRLWSRVLQGDALREIRLGIGEGVAGWVAREGLPIVLDDAHEDPRFDPTWDHASGYRTKALLAVPLRNKDDEVVAVVQCLNKSGGFTEEDVGLLVAVGGPIGVALENAVLYQRLLVQNAALQQAQGQLHQANAELEVLFDLERRAAVARDEEDLLGIALERVCHHLQAATGALLVERGKDTQVVLWRGGRLGVRPHGKALARAVLDRFDGPRWLDPNELRVEPALDLTDAVATGADRVLVAPLTVQGRAIGLVQVAGPIGCCDDAEATIRLLALLGAQIGRAIELQRSRAAEDRARRLSSLGQALSTILHDLRTPMSAIDGYAELMFESDDPDERSHYAKRIRRALEHMETMTREVLEFARGERELLLSNVHLNRFVEDTRGLVEPTLQRQSVAFVIDDRYGGAARFDEGKLLRVVANLARNAAEAMPRGGCFSWRIDRRSDHLVMEFADTGAGIPDDNLDHLFESFATWGKKNGTGLGLAMARRIVEAHRGTISCVASSPLGTTFRIELPIEGPPTDREPAE